MRSHRYFMRLRRYFMRSYSMRSPRYFMRQWIQEAPVGSLRCQLVVMANVLQLATFFSGSVVCRDLESLECSRAAVRSNGSHEHSRKTAKRSQKGPNSHGRATRRYSFLIRLIVSSDDTICNLNSLPCSYHRQRPNNKQVRLVAFCRKLETACSLPQT